jgi:hypothetical protein
MAGMHHVLILASRVMAGIVGGIAFYFAFFLYENEEGIWQNRIENLWSSVYDRAKVTDSTTLALFNKIAETLNEVFNHAFGKRLISVRAFINSFNLSLGVLAIFALFFSLVAKSLGLPFSADRQTQLGFIALSVVSCTLVFMPDRFTIRMRTPLLFAPFAYTAFYFIYDSRHDAMMRGMLIFQLPLILLSFVSDCVGIVVMRRLFIVISRTLSVLRLVLSMIALFMIPILLTIVLPEAYIKTMAPSIQDLRPEKLSPIVAGGELMMLNLSTFFICLIPAAMLVVVLSHKLLWPVLSRLLYPVASRKVITNRKALVPVGSLCLLYAMNVAQVGVKDVLKLFS